MREVFKAFFLDKNMHYFKKNIGDYAKKTGRLTMLQHGAYTLLIDACYDRERFPTEQEAIDWTWSSFPEEVDAVIFVLNKFFTFENDVYVQKRIQEEIAEYHDKAETNKRIAMEREAKRKGLSTNRAQTVNDTPPNQEPLTNNHKPLTIIKTKPTTQAIRPDNVLEEVWQDFIAIRNKVKKPFTETALKIMQREAAKAGYSIQQALETCCGRGWMGFEAKWVLEKKTASEARLEQMGALTNGMATPKTAQNFWNQSSSTVEAANVECKRLL